MSLISALNIGTSGMESNSTDLSVIGDNIANANTIGFKASRTAFEEQLMQQLIGGVGAAGPGMGSRVQAIQKLLTQGTLTSTGVATDLAIQGNGMFVVKGTHNGMTGQYYTRAGQFSVDKDGYMVNLEGLRVQGYSVDPTTGNMLGTLGDMQVGAASDPAKATQNITLKGNLDSNAVVPTNAFSPADPSSYNFRNDVTVYDSLGNAHDVTLYYVKTASGTWDWHAYTDGAGLTGGTAGTPQEIASGSLTFGTNGELTGSTVTTNNFTPLGATSPQALNFDFGTPAGGTSTGFDGITQTAMPANSAEHGTITFVDQDGNAAGVLASIQVDQNGDIIGAFTNGDSRTIGQVAIADFAAGDQLTRIGGNLYQETVSSGQANIGAASSGGRGSIVAGALEQSNVDLANEFVRMIAAQRGFEANSKTISTADQLLTELMQLKR